MAESESGKKKAEPGKKGLDFLHDVSLGLAVEFGRVELNVRNLLGLNPGSVIELNKLSGEALDILINGRLVARGEAVIVNEKFGIRVTEIVSPEEFTSASAAGEETE